MDPLLNIKIICTDEIGTQSPKKIFGNNVNSGNIIVRSSKNSELLYVDGACDGGSPVYIGITKSRGTQSSKQPVESGDILGGLQVYGRVMPGDSLGYNHAETPLCGSLIFKVAEGYNSGSKNIPTELLIVTGNVDSLQIKLLIDSSGTLKVAGNIETGELVVTDKLVTPLHDHPVKFIKVIHQGKPYAVPLYQI
jgi:hypothetical protein